MTYQRTGVSSCSKRRSLWIVAMGFAASCLSTMTLSAQNAPERPQQRVPVKPRAASENTGRPPAPRQSPAQQAAPQQAPPQQGRPANAAPAANGNPNAPQPNPTRQAANPARNPLPPAPPAPQAPIKAPFQLSPPEQKELDEMLDRWQAASQKIETLKCDFKRYEYDEVFKKNTARTGELRYRRPDEGLYRVQGDTPEQPWSEHWVCDGLSIYEFKYDQKELLERPLPARLRGKAIEDGPLPFIFNTDAAKLKQRYFMRLMPSQKKGQLQVEAWPRHQKDAANFDRVDLILREADMLPIALQIHMSNGQSRTVHVFDTNTVIINSKWTTINGDFAKPKAPRGWNHRIEEVAEGDVPPEPGAAPPPRQADQSTRRPTTERK